MFLISVNVSFAADASDNSKKVSYKKVGKVSEKTATSSSIASQTKKSSKAAAGDDVKPTKLSQSDIVSASQTVNNYIVKNERLPNSVTISDYKFSMPEFMYLLAKTVEYKYEKADSKISIKYSVKNPTDPSGDRIDGKISSVDIRDYTTRVANFIVNEGVAPNYVNTPLGQIQYQQTIYSFIKILDEENDGTLPKSMTFNFKRSSPVNDVVPKYVRPGEVDSDVDVKPSITNLSGRSGLLQLQKYMNKNFNHRSGASHTAAGVEKTGYGDCWGLADWASKVLDANGYTVRVVQGSSSAASNHRWVQVKLDGDWVNFESSLVTKRYGSKHYTTTCASVNTVVKYL